MIGRKKEIGVGLFVLIGLVCVAWLTVRLGRMELFGSDGYTLQARFTSVVGLKTGAAVEIAGVPVGRVSGIRLNQDKNGSRAVVLLHIDKGIALGDDVIASVKTSGLIGDKYILLTPGGSETPLGAGDTIVDTESALDIEELISKYVFGKV